MIISRKHRILFLHSPKTGGISIETALFRIDETHSLATEENIKNLLKNPLRHCNTSEVMELFNSSLLDRLTKFAVVRHPICRIRSEYNYNLHNSPHYKTREYTRQFGSFESWIFNHLPKKKGRQSDWTHYEGNQFVDILLRFENLNFEFSELMRKKNISAKLPHINSSFKYNTEPLSNRAEAFARNILRDEFDLYDYE